MADRTRKGDVVLVDGFANGLMSASIRLGNTLRYGLGNPYARWTHVALVYDARHQNEAGIEIVEATAASGVILAFLSKYRGRHTIVHTGVRDNDWKEVKEFVDSVLEARETYGFVTWAGLTLYAVTGTKLCLEEAGTATCSGLVCDALTRAGFVWSRPPYACTPADIAADLAKHEAPGVPRDTKTGG